MKTGFCAAIFDLDGVLVDTAELHYRAWKRLTDELGIPFDRTKNERLKGVPRMRSLDIILEDVATPPGDPEALAERKNRYYLELVSRISPQDLLPGVRAYLEQLRDKGTKVGVASSSKNAKTVIRHLEIDDLLDAVVDGFDYDRPKPDPDIFLKCSALLGVRAEEAIVVEDAQAGIDAAKAAGMYAVGIGSPGALKGADLVVSGVTEIPLSLWGGSGESDTNE